MFIPVLNFPVAFCVLFRPSQRFAIILSDLGLFLNMACLVLAARTPPLTISIVMRLYGVPWILLNHWVAMIVSLQHTDVMLPRYRDGAYTFARGALVTVDRDFLGWQGKFFLHCVSPLFLVPLLILIGWLVGRSLPYSASLLPHHAILWVFLLHAMVWHLT